MINPFRTYKNIIRHNFLFIPFLLLVGIVSCENDIEVVKSLGKTEKIPDVKATNLDILYSDSALVKGRVTAPEMVYFSSIENPYYEYPKGIHIYIFDDSLKQIAEMYSKYAINKDESKLWEARNDVVVINVKGEKLNTEQLFWDMRTKRIYSNKYCRITLPDGTQQIGEKGMDAQDDFSNWTLFGFTGSKYIDDPQ